MGGAFDLKSTLSKYKFILYYVHKNNTSLYKNVLCYVSFKRETRHAMISSQEPPSVLQPYISCM